MHIARTTSKLVLGFGLAVTLAAAPPAGAVQGAAFGQCVAGLRSLAAEQGYPPETLDAAFADIRQSQRVLRLDRQQPEFFFTFWDYIERTVTNHRVERGRRLLERHHDILQNVYRDFGVRPEYLLAFWGLETNYGNVLGGFSVLNALATLACDERRGEFFTKEFFSALKIVEAENIPVKKLRGSWAGAMGHTQFLPSVFLEHALDFDADGRRDIYGSLPDVFASSANYLRAIGWQPGERWGREVIAPKNFDWSLANPQIKKPISEWNTLGIKTAFGDALPAVDIEGSVIAPAGFRGPAFLVYGNFDVAMRWNRSTSYALAVGILADRITGSAGLVTKKPRGFRPLTRDDVVEIQTTLNDLGYDSGEPDGVVGRQTRSAAREFQLQAGLVADGFPDKNLLYYLRKSRKSAQ